MPGAPGTPDVREWSRAQGRRRETIAGSRNVETEKTETMNDARERTMLTRVSSDRPIEMTDDARHEPWRRTDWQRLWLAARNQPWRSLALVPGGAGAPRDFTVQIAVSLARTGMMHLGVPIHVADGTRVPLAQLMQFVQEIQYHSRSGDLVLVALAPASENPTAVSLAKTTDQAMMCVLLNRMNMADVKKSMDQIGQRQFIGAATFHG